MQGAVVLRPEPGNARTLARLAAAGIAGVGTPLFAVVPVGWQAPEPAAFDAVLLTSANAVRHAGAGLRALAARPMLAVGEATAAAARAAGIEPALIGERDAAALVAAARADGYRRLLHLAGRDRIDLPDVEAIAVYRSDPLPLAAGAARCWAGRVALLHSARAARRFAELVDRDKADRATIAIAALSPAVHGAAGAGWGRGTIAERPTDASLVKAVAALIDPSRAAVDKRSR